MLTFEGVTKRFPGRPVPAIEELDLEVRDGELLGLVGLNGAGKTTAIRIAVGLALPTRGRVEIDGHDIVRDKVRASERVGWVSEMFPYEPSAKARSLLVYYAGFNGITGTTAKALAHDLLSKVGLGGVEDQRIRTFSQGMKRRFGLAAMMLTDPQNLLLDEILNGLDPEGIAFVREWIAEQKRAKKAVLLSSHLLAELEAVADRVAFVHKGHLLKTIDRAELGRASMSVVKVTLETPDPAALEVLRTFGTVIEKGTTLVLSDATQSTADINSELIKRGFRVAEIRRQSESLEAYFLQLLEEAS